MTDQTNSASGDRYNATFADQHNPNDESMPPLPSNDLDLESDCLNTDQLNADLADQNAGHHDRYTNEHENLVISSEAAANLSQPFEQRTVLTIADLCFSYADRPNVLQGINLQVNAGEKIGLIGPNGAGKTTLFLIICGVLAASRGWVDLFAKPIETGKFRSEIGLVFQNPNDQLFSASVWDDVAFGPINMGLPADEVAQRVQSALEITGVTELAQRPPHHLSGGEKRMVAIASVLACGPQLIIYDEPSANLDIRSRRRLIQFLQASPETRLVCSHDLELILEVCDRVILLDQGRIMADGIATRIMGDRQLMIAHGLERPHSLEHLNPDGHSH
jgi:cobalt/nickel transport system ATP-binding protein